MVGNKLMNETPPFISRNTTLKVDTSQVNNLLRKTPAYNIHSFQEGTSLRSRPLIKVNTFKVSWRWSQLTKLKNHDVYFKSYHTRISLPLMTLNKIGSLLVPVNRWLAIQVHIKQLSLSTIEKYNGWWREVWLTGLQINTLEFSACLRVFSFVCTLTMPLDTPEYKMTLAKHGDNLSNMLGVICKSSQATKTSFYIFHFNFLFMQNLTDCLLQDLARPLCRSRS